MTSAEEELEATIWAALTRHKVTCAYANDLLADLVAAAVAYAAGDSETLTAARRLVLHEATAPSPRQTSPGDAGESAERTAPELFLRAPAPPGQRGAVGGATLSTGQSVPRSGKACVNSLPQPVDNRRALLGIR